MTLKIKSLGGTPFRDFFVLHTSSIQYNGTGLNSFNQYRAKPVSSYGSYAEI